MIGTIEDAIITRIRAAEQVLGYKLKKVDTYGGDFDDGLERLVRDFPAVLVAYKGFVPLKKTHSLMTVTAKWALICCALSLRNEAASRRGSLTGVGSYQLTKDMISILMGQTFGLPITAIMPTGVTPLINNKAGTQLASIYGLDIETTFTIDIVPDSRQIDNFETFHANWDLTGTCHKENLPADDTAAATDNIQLEE